MADPSCVVALSYYEASCTASPKFSYHCISSCRGWCVQPDGSIVPPSRSRVVEIRLGYPQDTSIAGFQLTSQLKSFPISGKPNYYIEEGIDATYELWPNSQKPTILILNFDAVPAQTRLFYGLAVLDSKGEPAWDEPKIYVDPDQ